MVRNEIGKIWRGPFEPPYHMEKSENFPYSSSGMATCHVRDHGESKWALLAWAEVPLLV